MDVTQSESSTAVRKMDVTESESESSTKVTKMDLLDSESESSTKRMPMDADSIAPVHAPLPAFLTTSHINPPCVHPSTLVEIRLNKDGSFKPHDPKFEMGTTAVAFTFDKGIIIAVDHSSKLSNSAKNLFELNSHMLATISGGSERLRNELQETRMTSAAGALKWLTKTLSAYKGKLSVRVLIASWKESECSLYRINGKLEVAKDDILATGSGLDAATVVVHKLRKQDMSITEAAEVAKKAICIAANRAPHSGDIFTVYHLGSGGCNKVLEGDIEEWIEANLKSPRWEYEVIGKGW